MKVAVIRTAAFSTRSASLRHARQTNQTASRLKGACAAMAQFAGAPSTRAAMNAEGIISWNGPRPALSIACWAWRVGPKKPAQAPGPKASSDKSKSAEAEAAAAHMVRQRPSASTAMGNSTAICGLNTKSPRRRPATMGRERQSARPPISSAAVKAPFWPRPTLVATAGAAIKSQRVLCSAKTARAAG